MIDASNQVIQGFWSGPITTMERLSMQSFLANGHEYHLYAYPGGIPNPEAVPAGVVILNAEEIVPQARVETFRCSTHFSDFFRASLLLKKGGWHSDLDNVALMPLGFPEPYCFYRDQDESTISFALSKAPPGSPLMQYVYSYIDRLTQSELDQLSWQAIGPDFTHGAIEHFQLTQFAQPGYRFDPVHWSRARDLINPAADPPFDLSRSYSCHLFHAVWNGGPQDRCGRGWNLGQDLDARMDTDGEYHPDCLYEKLKRRYL